jgi:hypothetical protein
MRIADVRNLRSRSPRLPLLAALLAVVSGLPLVNCGASLPPVTNKPVADLRLVVSIYNQYVRLDDTSKVYLQVSLVDAETHAAVSPPKGARITCNGADVTPTRPPPTFSPCPAQASGSYAVVYTDQHGAATTVQVPVPTGPFAILSPRPKDTVAIPTDTLAIYFVAPTVLSGGSVIISPVTAWCGDDNGILGKCGVVGAEAQNKVLPTPGPTHSGSAAMLAEFAATPTPPPTPSPAGSPTPRPTPPPDATATATGVPTPTSSAVIEVDNKGGGVIFLPGTFAGFTSGPGQVDVLTSVQVNPEPSGFQSVTATYLDHFEIPITWAR